MDTKIVKQGSARRRRRHSPEFKAQVIEACMQPGVSVAGVALANGLNANYLRRWLKDYRESRSGGGVAKTALKATLVPTTIVPVTIQASSLAEVHEIRIDIRRAQTTVQIACPVCCAEALGEWLREVLR